MRVLSLLLAALLCLTLPLSAQEPPPEPAPVDQLLELLRDPATVEALVRELEARAPEAAAAEAAGPPAAPVGLSRQLAELTQETADRLVDEMQRLWRSIVRLPLLGSTALEALDLDLLIQVLEELAFVIVATYGALAVLKAVARLLHRRLAVVARAEGFAVRILLILLSSVIDLIAVGLAYGAAFALTLLFSGTLGTIEVRQTIYLNAFLAVELGRVAVRVFLAPRVAELRLIPLGTVAAQRIAGAAGTAILILGYGQLVAVPVIRQQVGYLAAIAVGTVIAVLVILMGMVSVLRRSGDVARTLRGEDPGRFRSLLAGLWWLPAMGYLGFLLVVVIARPGDVLFDLLRSTAQIVGAVAIGAIVVSLLSQAIANGIRLPFAISRRLPLLERRLNGFVPMLLSIIRFLVIVGVIGAILDVLGWVDVTGWLTTGAGAGLSAGIVSVLLLLTVAFLIWLAFASWVDLRLNPLYGKIATSRETTLLALLRNAATIALVIVTMMLAFSELGLDIAPLLASAGVLGLAIGFGAQKLVQDIITGVFIQFENAMNVGDVVSVGGVTGTVERLTVRSVSLRDLEGVFHIIPFSSVDLVSNYMRDYAYTVVDVGIAYREDTEDGKAAMQAAFERVKQDPEVGPGILGDLEWFGVQSLADSAVVLRGRIKTLPGKQWGVQRAYYDTVKRVMDDRGLEIPFPHQTLYFGTDREGNAPPLHIKAEGGRAPEPAPVQGPQRPATAPDLDDVPDS